MVFLLNIPDKHAESFELEPDNLSIMTTASINLRNKITSNHSITDLVTKHF